MENKTTAKKAKITFVSGVGTVTGANFLFETMPEGDEKPVRIVIDCGLEQGTKEAPKRNRQKFSYDPSTIDYLFVTHAHIDHIGRVPKLVKEGFKGKIFSTLETLELAPLMLEDSARLLARESEKDNLPPLYDENDIRNSLSLWREIPYHVPIELHGGLSVFAKDAGHILGSAMFEFTLNGRKIVFTGDLGNSPTPLLKDTEDIVGADYMVMESVYGDRDHESTEQRKSRLEDVIEDAHKRGGALIVPCFSLEKTQVVLSEINSLVEEGRVPSMPVFLDSPLAIKVTEVYRNFHKNFNEESKKKIEKGDDIFNFPRLKLILSTEDSKNLATVPNPKIIIAGSGMSNGGRIVHHEAQYLPDPKSTILLIGYQTLGTLGRHIQNGEKHVSIFGDKIEVRAKVEMIDGYSSHKDSTRLIEFVEKGKDTLKKVFPVMGEPKSSLFLAQRIQDYVGVSAHHPKEGEEVILDF